MSISFTPSRYVITTPLPSSYVVNSVVSTCACQYSLMGGTEMSGSSGSYCGVCLYKRLVLEPNKVLLDAWHSDAGCSAQGCRMHSTEMLDAWHSDAGCLAQCCWMPGTVLLDAWHSDAGCPVQRYRTHST